jgi:hypothetical protein
MPVLGYRQSVNLVYMAARSQTAPVVVVYPMLITHQSTPQSYLPALKGRTHLGFDVFQVVVIGPIKLKSLDAQKPSLWFFQNKVSSF